MELSPQPALRGVWVDTLTPLQSDLRADADRLYAHLRNLSARGAHRFVLFGHAGEGASFSTEEKLAVLQAVLEHGMEPENLMLGVQTSSLTEAAAIVKKACALQVRRFLVTPPAYYVNTSGSGVRDYFAHLLQSVPHTDWQLMIHQTGQMSKAGDLPDASIAELVQAYPETLVGIVDQDPRVDHTLALMRSFGKRLSVSTSHEPNLTQIKPSGCISAYANLLPKTVAHIVAQDTSTQGHQVPGLKVRTPDERVLELQKIQADFGMIQTFKLFLSTYYRIADWERVRPPLSPVGADRRENLLKAFKSFNLQASE